MVLSLLDAVDPEHLLATFGTIGLFAIIYAETGLLAGFFLPGDSLLFTAGLLASQGKLTIWVIVPGVIIAAILGDQTGYLFGKRVGPSLFSRPESRLFKQAHVQLAREYFEDHGPRTIVLARFVPIVRTFAPVLAGVGAMPYSTFVRYNVVGGFIWGGGVTMGGFILGETVPSIDKYLLPVIGVVVLLSVLPAVLEVRRHRGQKAEKGDTTPFDATAEPDERHLL